VSAALACSIVSLAASVSTDFIHTNSILWSTLDKEELPGKNEETNYQLLKRTLSFKIIIGADWEEDVPSDISDHSVQKLNEESAAMMWKPL
jgi:hypothetical protein